MAEEIGKLKRLHKAICKWQEVAATELDEFQHQCSQNHNPAWDEYGYDPVLEEAFMLQETERVMYANFAVTIASVVENFIINICNVRGVACVNDFGETHFGIACQCLGCSLKVVIHELPGYTGTQQARLLGNCFKHSDGKKNQRFVNKYGGFLDEIIEYENEDWLKMIAETKLLFSGIVQRLRPKK
ncbi:MAG: hypothetical protein JKY95_14675 [Planctomycetaceae bacterium]|nr:hypothetical protein [Planctomycetaceae bacterium]